MPTRPLRTRDIARALGVHVNTIRLYEASGYLPAIPRDLNGYRHYSNLHLEQARLVQLALQWPTLGDRALLLDLVTRAASGDCGMAMELAYQYLVARGSSAPMPRRRLSSLSAGWRGQVLDTHREQVRIGAAARQLGMSVDMLRGWERNGLIEVPRDPANQYRCYGAAEFGRLRVIRTLAQAGYSQMAILTMLRQVDAGNTDDHPKTYACEEAPHLYPFSQGSARPTKPSTRRPQSWALPRYPLAHCSSERPAGMR